MQTTNQERMRRGARRMAMVITSLALGVSFAAGSSISASAAAKLSSTKVTVCAKDSHCAASKTTITLKGTKKSYTVKAANNSAIAKVAKKGKKVTITGKKAGTTVVSLKLKNGKTLKCKVKVTEHSYGAAVSQTIDGKTYDVYTCENCGKSYKVESTSVDNPTLPDNPSDNPSDTPSDVPGDTPGGDMPPGGMPGGDMPPGEGGGAGSAGQEFGTFDEVKNAAGIVVDKDTVTRNDAAGIDITEGEGSSITADGLVNVKIAMKTGIAASNGIAISKASETDKFVIENSEISVASGEENNTLGYEAAYGVGIGVETGELWVKNSTITADGSRATPIYMFSTSSPSATSLVVVDSTISTSGDVWMPSFKLLMGGSRATLLMTRNNSWFYGADVTATNWGAISQDSVDAYTYVINSTGKATEGGYATYLTYGMRLYGSQLYAGQYGIFMCGNSDIITDTASAALEDKDAMSKVPDYNVDTTEETKVAAPFNAIVVHNSLADISMVAQGTFKNTTLSTLASDLPSDVNAVSYKDDFFLPGVDILGSGDGCGAAYFFNKNLYGSIALIRSMNADFTFDNATLSSSNGVLVQSVLTYDPPSACGYLTPEEGQTVPGIAATFTNGDYTGDVLHEDYQRGMTVTIGEKASLTGKIVSGTYAAWNALWSEESLTAMLADDGMTPDVFNNSKWVEDVQTNLIRSADTVYADTQNIGVKVTVASGAKWIVNGKSSVASLTIAEGGSVSAPEGSSLVIYTDCDASNSKTFYDTASGKKVDSLTAGTYNNVVIEVVK